jgi:hypothetical protein
MHKSSRGCIGQARDTKCTSLAQTHCTHALLVRLDTRRALEFVRVHFASHGATTARCRTARGGVESNDSSSEV